MVDPVKLLHPLQVVLLRGSVRDGPQAQLVHVAQVGPTELEGHAHALVLQIAQFVLEGRLPNVVNVGDGRAKVLLCRLQVGQLVHFS